MSNALRLSLTLLHELHVQGTASRWWPYLSFLSTVEVDLPMTWPQSEWEGLRGTSLLLAGDFEPPAQVFREVAEPLMAQREDLWPEEVRKPELFLRALSLVMSRGLCGALSFALQGALAPELRDPGKAAGPFLLPLFDLVNHSSCSEELSVQLDIEEGSFVARCSKDVAAGQELLKSYGPHSAAELLRTYGFVERGSNAHNSLLVTHEELLDTCKEFVAPHLERLQDMAAVRPMYSIPSSGTLPAELLTVVQVLHMSSADFSEFQTSQTLSFPRGTTQGRKAVVCLLALLARLKRRLMPMGEAPAARAACAALRAAELQVLQEAQQFVIARLAPPEKRKAPKASATRKAKAAKKAEASSASAAVDGKCLENWKWTDPKAPQYVPSQPLSLKSLKSLRPPALSSRDLPWTEKYPIAWCGRAIGDTDLQEVAPNTDAAPAKEEDAAAGRQLANCTQRAEFIVFMAPVSTSNQHEDSRSLDTDIASIKPSHETL
ncbi:unnamed protein product [Effrenium voratum]|nr:unnamed protein product [Effrenium voratum]